MLLKADLKIVEVQMLVGEAGLRWRNRSAQR